MKKILLFIRSLEAGGAERQLVLTAKGLAARDYRVSVLTLYGDGFYANELSGSNVKLLTIRKKGRWDVLGMCWRLVRQLRSADPDTLYSFLPVANILSILAKPFIVRTRIVWGIRASAMQLDRYDRLTRFSYSVERMLSRCPDAIIANSHAGYEHSIASGMAAQKLSVVHNGIDTRHFRANKAAAAGLRKAWGLSAETPLIGLIGRIEPMKGYDTFLHAAARLSQQRRDVHFVCVGQGKADYELAMYKLSRKLGLHNTVHWTGVHDDMPAVYGALNLVTSCSHYGEGFPNVIGEAMACGVPCVVADSGDSLRIVGSTGQVVAKNDSNALADAWLGFLALDEAKRASIGLAARERVVREYDVDSMLDATERVLRTRSAD